MNKSQLIEQIYNNENVDSPSKAEVTRFVDAFIDVVTNGLKSGEDIALVGFGTFTVRERAARTGRNPQTGQTIEIAAAKVPAFKPGKALKDAVN